MNRMRLVAVALIAGVLAIIGVLGVWQRSEASDPRLGDAVVVKPAPSDSTQATTTRPAGSSRADTSAGKAARPVAPAPAPAAGDDDNDADDNDSDSDRDNDSDGDSDD